MYVGTLLFVVLLIQIFKDSKGIRLTAKILGYAILPCLPYIQRVLLHVGMYRVTHLGVMPMRV